MVSCPTGASLGLVTHQFNFQSVTNCATLRHEDGGIMWGTEDTEEEQQHSGTTVDPTQQWSTYANYGSLASATSRTIPSPGRLLRRLTALNCLQLYRHQRGRKYQMNCCPDAKILSSALSAGLIVVHRAKVCLHKMIFDHQSSSKTLRWFNKFRKKWLYCYR